MINSEKTRKKLHLVDLAGSERIGKAGVTGQIATEGKYINLSLHYLEQVTKSDYYGSIYTLFM